MKHKDLLGPTNQPVKQFSCETNKTILFTSQKKSFSNHPEGMTTVGKASKPAKQAQRCFSNLLMSCLYINSNSVLEHQRFAISFFCCFLVFCKKFVLSLQGYILFQEIFRLSFSKVS